MRAYLANGLFSESDRIYNKHIANLIRLNFEDIELYVPQENMSINDKSKSVISQDIAFADCERLLASHFVIAIIDGVEIDSGVAAEIGYACANHIPVYALLTDIRYSVDGMVEKFDAINKNVFENPIMYRNLFVQGLIKNGLLGGIYPSVEELISAIKNEMNL